MALALYRKHRPRTFAEVIGQEHVTGPLMQALRTGRLHHAYLFSGPRGCGKTSSARILARSLNCEHGPTPEPCGRCASCVALAPDGPGSIDVIEIDAASHGGVDDARDLRERAIFAPVSSRFKVYVIDEAHMVSPAGFNALLKLVEEPPDYVTFVFATTEPEKVLGTIKSRTHHYPFRLIPPGVLRPYLERLAATERIPVEPAVFPLVVRAGGGSVRDSLSVLDQLIAGAGPEGVSYAGAAALLGVTDAALIDEMCDALAAGDGAAVYAVIDRVAEAGHDPRRFASDLLERLRDLIILQQVPDAAAKGLLDAPDDTLARMTGQAQRFGPAMLSRFADIVHNGLTEMRGTTGPRLLLELVCARMLLPGADDSTGALLHRLERLERRLAAVGDAGASAPVPGPVRPVGVPEPEPAGAPTGAGLPRPARDDTASSSGSDSMPPPAAADEPAPAPRPAPAGPVSGGVVNAVAVRRVWDEILGYVRQRSPRAAAVVREATVRDVAGDVLVLSFQYPVHATMLTESPDLLVAAVGEVLGGPQTGGAGWRIRCEVSGDRAGPGNASPGGPARQGRDAGSVDARPAQPAAGRGAPGRVARERSAREPRGQNGSHDQSGPADDEGWPETARPGGGPAGDGAETGRVAAGSRSGVPDPSGVSSGRGGPPVSPAPGSPPPGARRPGGPAPAGADPVAGSVPPPGRGAAVGSPVATGRASRDANGPVVGGRVSAGEGFDPGDEPLDEVVDARTARQSAEEQALRLLHETLGAVKIGEVGAV